MTREANNTIIRIQQDNARPHIKPTDEQFVQAANTLGLQVRLVFQPLNSPDMNVLDLGYFNAIRSLQHQAAPKDVDELVTAVEESFRNLAVRKLNHVFLTLQKVMEMCILHKGNNDYKRPHISKEKLERTGELPCSILVSDEMEEEMDEIDRRV